jgi:hypothetical protein
MFKQLNVAELDEQVLERLHKRVENAAETLKRYEASCKTCRAATDDNVRNTVGLLNPYELGFTRRGDNVLCPTCERCVYSNES